MWLGEITTRQEQIPAGARSLVRATASVHPGRSSLSRSDPVPARMDWFSWRRRGVYGVFLTCVWRVLPVRKGRDWNHRGNPAPLSGIKLHCRGTSSHDGNKTRQMGTKLASSDPNPNARMDLLSRIRQDVCGALPYLCVWRVFSVRKGRDWNHRGNPAPLSGILLHCREKSSHDENKTRQTRTKLASSDPNPNARMDWLSRIRCVCVRCVTLLVCLMCVPCPKRQGLKSPRESCSTVGNPAPLSREKLARWEQNSPDENKTRQQRSQSHTCTEF